MTRAEIEGIKILQKGLYPWNKDLAVCELGDVREVLVGPRKGQAFRYVYVRAPGSIIGFIVAEGE
jgi:hypothetical protein